MSLVVTDFLSCGWPVVGTNFSAWVQIFQKNSFRGEPILGGSKLNVTLPWAMLQCFESTENRRERSREHTNSGFERLNWVHSLPLCSRLLGEWRNPPRSTGPLCAACPEDERAPRGQVMADLRSEKLRWQRSHAITRLYGWSRFLASRDASRL